MAGRGAIEILFPRPGDTGRSHAQMSLTQIEEAILVAAYYRGKAPSEQVWSSNSDQVLTLSLFYTGDISHNACASRFEHRPYLRCVYDDDGRLNEQLKHRYRVLIDLIQQHPDLINGGGDFKAPADPTYTACGLTDAGLPHGSHFDILVPKETRIPKLARRTSIPGLGIILEVARGTVCDQFA